MTVRIWVYWRSRGGGKCGRGGKVLRLRMCWDGRHGKRSGGSCCLLGLGAISGHCFLFDTNEMTGTVL